MEQEKKLRRRWRQMSLSFDVAEAGEALFVFAWGLFALELIDSVFVLLTPLPLKIAIDSVLGSRPLPALIGRFVPEQMTESTTTILYLAIGLMFGIAFFDSIQSFASSLRKAYVGEKMLLDFRAHLFRPPCAATSRSLTMTRQGTSDALYRIQKDAGAIEDILIGDALSVVGAAVTIVLMFSVTIWLDWQLAIVAAVDRPGPPDRLRHDSRDRCGL